MEMEKAAGRLDAWPLFAPEARFSPFIVPVTKDSGNILLPWKYVQSKAGGFELLL